MQLELRAYIELRVSGWVEMWRQRGLLRTATYGGQGGYNILGDAKSVIKQREAQDGLFSRCR